MNKICTSIEQSKKLAAGILPPESADTWYQHIGYSIVDGTEKPEYFLMVIRDWKSDDDVPCWSLAALQDIIKINYKLEKTLLDQSDYFTYSMYDSDDPTFKTLEYDNPVDACVEMVIKLHEQKLL